MASAGCAGHKPAQPPVNVDCASGDFNTVAVQSHARDSVLQLRNGDTAGTGFVLATSGSREALIVTNHHVVVSGDSITAIVPESSSMAGEVKVEVVKVDPENDLALLKGPPLLARVSGLSLSGEAPSLGQKVAALGYPGVRGSSYSLTAESGEVSGSRSLGGQEFIQTNANFNPGNSGGPILDSCAHVVGVAAATHREATAVGLVIPQAKVAELVRRYGAGRAAPEDAVPEQLDRFVSAVAYRRGEAAASAFSRDYLVRVVGPDFKDFVTRGTARMVAADDDLRRRGLPLDQMSVEQRFQLYEEALPADEFHAVAVALAIATERTDVYSGLRLYLAGWVTEHFGEIRSVTVEQIERTSPEAVSAYARVTTDRGTAPYRFDMAYEWGDWVIDDVQRLR